MAMYKEMHGLADDMPKVSCGACYCCLCKHTHAHNDLLIFKPL